MKICLINNLFEPFARGGAEQVTKLTALAAQAAGHEVLVISGAPQASRERYQGLDCRYVSAPWLFWPSGRGRYCRLMRHLFGRRTTRAIKAELLDFQPDLVISANLFGLGLATLSLPARLGLRHFHVLHDLQLLHPSGLITYGREAMVDAWPAKIYQALVRRHIGRIERVLSPSRWLLDWHAERRIATVEQLVKIDNPRPAPAAVRRAAKQRQELLFVGQLEEHKGLAVLLDAYQRLRGQGYRWHLVGSGSWAERLSAYQGPDFKLYGRLKSQEIADLLKQSGVMIMPSLVWENSPMVIAEAQAYGLAVLGSDFGGVAEVIDNPSYLFKAGSGEALAAKIKDWAAGRLTAPLKQPPVWTAADYWRELESFFESRS